MDKVTSALEKFGRFQNHVFTIFLVVAALLTLGFAIQTYKKRCTPGPNCDPKFEKQTIYTLLVFAAMFALMAFFSYQTRRNSAAYFSEEGAKGLVNLSKLFYNGR